MTNWKNADEGRKEQSGQPFAIKRNNTVNASDHNTLTFHNIFVISPPSSPPHPSLISPFLSVWSNITLPLPTDKIKRSKQLIDYTTAQLTRHGPRSNSSPDTDLDPTPHQTRTSIQLLTRHGPRSNSSPDTDLDSTPHQTRTSTQLLTRHGPRPNSSPDTDFDLDSHSWIHSEWHRTHQIKSFPRNRSRMQECQRYILGLTLQRAEILIRRSGLEYIGGWNMDQFQKLPIRASVCYQ